MDTYMHKIMTSVVSLEKIEIIRSQEFMPREARLKFLKKMIILGPKTANLGSQFWCWGLIFGGQGGPGAPLDPPLESSLVLLHRDTKRMNTITLYQDNHAAVKICRCCIFCLGNICRRHLLLGI